MQEFILKHEKSIIFFLLVFIAMMAISIYQLLEVIESQTIQTRSMVGVLRHELICVANSKKETSDVIETPETSEAS